MPSSPCSGPEVGSMTSVPVNWKAGPFASKVTSLPSAASGVVTGFGVGRGGGSLISGARCSAPWRKANASSSDPNPGPLVCSASKVGRGVSTRRSSAPADKNANASSSEAKGAVACGCSAGTTGGKSSSSCGSRGSPRASRSSRKAASAAWIIRSGPSSISTGASGAMLSCGSATGPP